VLDACCFAVIGNKNSYIAPSCLLTCMHMHEADMFAERPWFCFIYFNSVVFLQAIAYPAHLDKAVRVKRPRKRKVSFQ
jgi:hypothetical protein